MFFALYWQLFFFFLVWFVLFHICIVFVCFFAVRRRFYCVCLLGLLYVYNCNCVCWVLLLFIIWQAVYWFVLSTEIGWDWTVSSVCSTLLNPVNSRDQEIFFSNPGFIEVHKQLGKFYFRKNYRLACVQLDF